MLITDLNWLLERKQGIGGSDAAVILGLSKWKTPYQLYLDKTSTDVAREDDSPVIEWGKRLEPVIRQKYVDLTGHTVFVPGDDKIIAHPSIPWMLASLDGIVNVDGGRVFEAKNSRVGDIWGDPGTDQVPEAYLVQVQHYMGVTGFELADMAVLLFGHDFRIFEIPRDDDVIGIIMEAEEMFWKRVQDRDPPEPKTLSDLKLAFGRASKSAKVQATADVITAWDRLKDLKELAKEEDELKAVIIKHLGEADTLVDGDIVLATYKATKPGRRVDTDKLKSAGLYEEYSNVTPPTRRLLLK